MKIVIGAFYHESNTLNPYPTVASDFLHVSGARMLERVASTKVFQDAGAKIIPTLYAFGLSSGIVTEEAYRYYVNPILDTIREHRDLDGIWLHLHGSMTVENIGSGELQLLKEIRNIVGYDVPISLTLDLHANNAVDLHRYANIIRSYRTAPHTDQAETEQITASLLIDCIRNRTTIRPAQIRLPMIISGDCAVGSSEPMKSIFAKIEEIEQTPGISTASFFVGFAWADTENTASSVIVVPESIEYEQVAQEKAEEIARYVMAKRDEFKFDAIALEPEQALQTALESDKRPVYISDTGDNTTGGAPGINTTMLEIVHKRFLNNGEQGSGVDKKICIASILDPVAYASCRKIDVGDSVQISIGIGEGEHSKPVQINGVLKAKGHLLGYLGSTNDVIGDTCTISSGNVDIVIANKSSSFITANHFSKSGLDVNEYDIIIVKQGYLFEELSQMAALELFALTPGATMQLIERIPYRHLSRPLYPFDEVADF